MTHINIFSMLLTILSSSEFFALIPRLLPLFVQAIEKISADSIVQDNLRASSTTRLR